MRLWELLVNSQICTCYVRETHVEATRRCGLRRLRGLCVQVLCVDYVQIMLLWLAACRCLAPSSHRRYTTIRGMYCFVKSCQLRIVLPYVGFWPRRAIGGTQRYGICIALLRAFLLLIVLPYVDFGPAEPSEVHKNMWMSMAIFRKSQTIKT